MQEKNALYLPETIYHKFVLKQNRLENLIEMHGYLNYHQQKQEHYKHDNLCQNIFLSTYYFWN